MRLIDADETIKELTRQRDKYESHDWINLKESLINDGYDFAITDVEHMPTVEAIPVTEKAFEMFETDYETRLKADMVAVLEELRLSIEELDYPKDCDYACNGCLYWGDVDNVIQQKINALKEK